MDPGFPCPRCGANPRNGCEHRAAEKLIRLKPEETPKDGRRGEKRPFEHRNATRARGRWL